MREHVGLQIFKGATALWMRTPPLGFIVNTTGRRTTARAAPVGGRGSLIVLETIQGRERRYLW